MSDATSRESRAVKMTPRACRWCGRRYVAPKGERWAGCRRCQPTLDDALDGMVDDLRSWPRPRGAA